MLNIRGIAFLMCIVGANAALGGYTFFGWTFWQAAGSGVAGALVALVLYALVLIAVEYVQQFVKSNYGSS